jgi:hypothetical protein
MRRWQEMKTVVSVVSGEKNGSVYWSARVEVDGDDYASARKPTMEKAFSFAKLMVDQAERENGAQEQSLVNANGDGAKPSPNPTVAATPPAANAAAGKAA